MIRTCGQFIAGIIITTFIMRDENKSKNSIKTLRVLLAALVLGAAFLLPQTGRAITLPTTPCDTQQANAAHLTSNATLEDGNKAFVYGSNNDFVSRTGNTITFNVDFLFNPATTAYIKAFFMGQNCAVGAAPAFGDIFTQNNVVSYDFSTDLFSTGGQSTRVLSNVSTKYIWIEIWDGINNSNAASYSYLVDTDDIQNPTGEPPEPSEPSGLRPVLIIPGITGTDLFNESTLIWPDLLGMLGSSSDQFILNNLNLNLEGESIQTITTGDINRITEITPFFRLDIFQSLINDIENTGYGPENSYFIFPYDWRLNLDSSISLLNTRIETIKTLTNFNKIDIIAHSMGGLLAEDYIDQYGHDSINKLIFVGTPHLGSPKSAKTIMHGDNLSIPFLNRGTVKELSKNMPSIYELLPNQNYFSETNGYLMTSSNTNAPRLNYNESKKFILSRGGNSNVFAQAENFFAKNLEDTDFTGVDTYNIAGCWTGTQSAYSYRTTTGSLAQIGYGNGDGTVPLASADYINIASNKKYYVKSIKHAELPSANGVRQLMLDILSNSLGSLAGNITQNSNNCNLQGVSLLWRSPVTVHIYDSGNNHLGPGDNDSIDLDIPGADYEIIDGEKFVFLPTSDGQTYTIQGLGEDNATFDLLISTIDNGVITGTQIFNDIPINPDETVEFTINNTSNNDAITVQGETVQSNGSLTAEQSSDLVSPVTMAEESGPSFGPKQLILNATDNNAGILSTNYSFTGSNYQTYGGPIAISAPGITFVYYYSVDNAGNNEPVKMIQIGIATTGGSIPTPKSEPPVASESTDEEAKINEPLEDGAVLGEKIEQPKTSQIHDSVLVLDISDGRTVYIIGNNGKKFGFISEQVFWDLGYTFENAVKADVSGYELGGLIQTAEAPHPNGSLVLNNGIIWYINNDQRVAFISMESFLSYGFKIEQIVSANEFDMALTEDKIIN